MTLAPEDEFLVCSTLSLAKNNRQTFRFTVWRGVLRAGVRKRLTAGAVLGKEGWFPLGGPPSGPMEDA